VPSSFNVHRQFLTWHQRSKRRWHVAAILLFLGTSLRAANMAADFLVDTWTSENGLPDSSVTAVAQTPDGYLWVGTYNGVTRFDGVRFVTFDPANTPALTHARVRRLSVDARGALWISTYDGALTKYENGVFTLEHRNSRATEGEVTFVASSSSEVVFLSSRGELLRKPAGSPPGEGWIELPPPARGIGALGCQDGHGTLWYRDGDRHLWRLAGAGFESLPDTAGLGGQNVNCLTTDARGRFWIGTDNEFAFWDGNKFQNAVPAGADTLEITYLSVTPDGHVWAVANGSVCEAYENRWLLPPDASRNIFSGNPGRIGGLEDHHGGMWFFNYGRGLWNVSADGQTRQLGLADGFPGERVYGLIEDRDGDWWAGLDAGGLARLRSRQFHAPPVGENPLAPAAKTICADDKGVVWIGRLSGGLDRWQNGVVTNLPVIADGANAGPVFCVCPDHRGRLWLSAGDEDLFEWDGDNFKRIVPVVHGVKAILADQAGRIWAGTTAGLYLSEDGSPENFRLFKPVARRSIRSLAEDRAGPVWMGMANGELMRIVSNTVAVFQPTDAAGSSSIWSVLADGETVWAGTFRGGLLRFRNGEFTRFGKKNGLPDDVICQILDDGQGNLWLGSHQGVFRVAKTALDQAVESSKSRVESESSANDAQPSTFNSQPALPCFVYGRSDGIPSLECSGGYQPAGWRDGAGRLWFATAKGATWVQPQDVRPNLKPPLVAIEEILVDGRRVEESKLRFEGANGASNHQLSTFISQPLVIPPGRHQIEFRFTGLSFASPERVQFRYRLDNLDPDWIQAGTRRFAQYNFLPPGNYRFHVLACNSDEIWNETGCEIAVIIKPHVYETWWFRALAALLVLGTVAAVVRQVATRRLHLKMEQLERRQAVERERARIAKDIHDDLGASLNLIAVLGDLAKEEKSGERIEKMSGTARQAVKSLDEIVWAVNPRNDTLSHLVDYICQYTNDYLRDADIRCLLDVPEQVPAREVPANVRHNLFLAVKEALQNVVKHAHASRVELRLQLNADDLRLDITDNGRGFDRPPPDDRADGLNNMRQRLAEIGGECRFESQINAGTTVSLLLPLSGTNP
jgi:signal transduction histidine kinase/ligand-binding sensor domain-containing protein